MSLVGEALRELRRLEPRERTVSLAVTRAVEYLRQHLDVEQAAADRDERLVATGRRTPPPADYPVAQVRAWAKAQGLAVPARGGHLPADVVAAWRASGDNGTSPMVPGGQG